MAKDRLMVRHRRLQFTLLTHSRCQYLGARDDPAFDLVEDDLPPKLDGDPRLAPLQDAGMGFKPTHELLLGRDFAALQHPCARLADHPLDQGENVVHDLPQPLAPHPLCCAGAQAPEVRARALLDLPSRLDDRLGRLEQPRLELKLLGFDGL